MVSIRRQKQKVGGNGRSSSWVSLRDIPCGNPQNHGQRHLPANVLNVPQNSGLRQKPASVGPVPEDSLQSGKSENVKRAPRDHLQSSENRAKRRKPSNIHHAPEQIDKAGEVSHIPNNLGKSHCPVNSHQTPQNSEQSNRPPYEHRVFKAPGESCRLANMQHASQNLMEGYCLANVFTITESPGENCSVANQHRVPSAWVNQPVEGTEDTKTQKTDAQIDPENPMEVHSYLMKLKEDKKLDIRPLQRSEDMSVKEWMEKLYPFIFSVFPQSPKVFSQFPDQAKLNELLYSHYWLFLFEVRNIVLMDNGVSPDCVETSCRTIKVLEMHGFDCRFMRSELKVVGYKMQKQKDINLAERDLIAKRAVTLEKELRNLTRSRNVAELNNRENVTEERNRDLEMAPKQQEEGVHKGEGKPVRRLLVSVKQEYIEVVLDQHKKLLTCKEEEGKRLGQVLNKISQLQRNKTA